MLIELINGAPNQGVQRPDFPLLKVSRSASELELILGVIKNYCKARLGRDSVSAATEDLHVIEGMRKEFGHARFLAFAQAQYLRVHDEIKMVVSRLHLRTSEDDKSLDALGENELVAASSNFSHEKFFIDHVVPDERKKRTFN